MKEEYWDITTINKFSSWCLKDLVKERRELNISVLEIVVYFNTTWVIIWRKKKKARGKSASWNKCILFLLSSAPQKWRDKNPFTGNYFFQIQLKFIDTSKKLVHTTDAARAKKCKAQDNQLYIKLLFFFLSFFKPKIEIQMKKKCQLLNCIKLVTLLLFIYLSICLKK